MQTESTPVESPKLPPLPDNLDPPVTADDLEDVTIRVVRLDQLAKPPAPPAPTSTPPAPRTPVTQASSAAAPAERAPPPAAAQRQPAVNNARPSPTVSAPVAPAPVARSPAPAVPRPAPEAPPPAAPAARAPVAPAVPPPATRRESPPETRPAVARPSARPEAIKRKRGLTWNRIGFIALIAVLYLGWTMPTERYITPTRGFGYWLGIIGGSLMLLLLVYSARKHFRWLRFLGPTPAWFRFHMVLGIAGPLCILFHSNFKTGAANSNVALFCMLTVASSGFIGRYLYAHIHSGLYGRKLELGELQASASGLRDLSASVSFLPDLVAQLEVAEQRLLASGPRLSILGFLKPVVVGFAATKARWQLHRYIRRGLRASARASTVIAAESKRLRRVATAYIDRRLTATQRVAEFQGYERLFSLWHALHIPLIFMLIIAAIVHVIAVNVY
jgi:hypothetical protein